MKIEQGYIVDKTESEEHFIFGHSDYKKITSEPADDGTQYYVYSSNINWYKAVSYSEAQSYFKEGAIGVYQFKPNNNWKCRQVQIRTNIPNKVIYVETSSEDTPGELETIPIGQSGVFYLNLKKSYNISINYLKFILTKDEMNGEHYFWYNFILDDDSI